VPKTSTNATRRARRPTSDAAPLVAGHGPGEPPRQWEVRAALRAMTRSDESGGRSVAHDIVAAAWALVEGGDHDFTVKQVTERANVALQTFYRHFPSKDELLLAMLEESISQGARSFITSAAGDPPTERLRRLVTTPILLPFDENARRINRWRARERQRLLEVFPEAVEAVFEPYRAALVAALVAARDAGVAACDDPELTGTIVMHLVQSMTHAVHGGGLDTPPAAAAESIWQLCWEGLAVHDDRERRTRHSRHDSK
jgi:AcrR family transcriptional regulator